LRYIPLPQAPRNRGFTILLALLWVALVLYILTHPDPFGFIVLGVFTVFVVPLFILAFRLRHEPDEREADASADESEPTHRENGHV
jgi:hypothetical protein